MLTEMIHREHNDGVFWFQVGIYELHFGRTEFCLISVLQFGNVTWVMRMLFATLRCGAFRV